MRPLRALALAIVLLVSPIAANAATNLLACDSVWPPSSGGGRESNAPALISDGNVLFNSGDFRGAAMKYVSASQSDADIVALHNLGAALERLGQTRLGGQLCASAWVSILTKQTRAPITGSQLEVVQTGLKTGNWPQTPTPATTAPPTVPPTSTPTTPPPTLPPPTKRPTTRPSTPPPPAPSSTSPPASTPTTTSRPLPTPIVTHSIAPTPTSSPTPVPASSPTSIPPSHGVPMIPLPTAAVDTGVGVFVGLLIGVAFGVQAMRRRDARRRAQARRVKLDVEVQDK